MPPKYAIPQNIVDADNNERLRVQQYAVSQNVGSERSDEITQLQQCVYDSTGQLLNIKNYVRRMRNNYEKHKCAIRALFILSVLFALTGTLASKYLKNTTYQTISTIVSCFGIICGAICTVYMYTTPRILSNDYIALTLHLPCE
jgi:hypothetical protein